MAYEDDVIKQWIKAIDTLGPQNTTVKVTEVLTEFLKKINKLEQEVKELRNGGKKLK